MVKILNEREYRSAKSRLAQIKQAKDDLMNELALGFAEDVTAARRTALRTEYHALSAAIKLYESLKSGSESNKFEGSDMGLLPIIGRIARGLSQRELADMLGIKEQQVQRYESERYAGISLGRYKLVLDKLGVAFEARLGALPEKNLVPGGDSLAKLTPEVAREVKARDWFSYSDNDMTAEIERYVEKGQSLIKGAALNRQNVRDNAKLDHTALALWQSRVLQLAQGSIGKARFDFLDMSWIPELRKLSVFEDGPVRARAFLQAKGIAVIVEPHLPKTRLDGSAFLMSNNTPVIGLTLRYDRIDHFWYTLMHEIGHVLLHLRNGLEFGFFDNLEATDNRDFEIEADSFARTALIPDEVWKAAPARFSKSLDLARSFAAARGIHPAIVVGRIRRERGDYSLFKDAVGAGRIRSLFLERKHDASH